MADALWIALAFAAGLLARQAGLPPMVGFLGAGFALEAIGFSEGETLELFSELGVTLLLFTIGLKLRVRSLLRPEIWGVAVLHMAAATLALGGGLLALAALSLPPFAGLDLRGALLVAFALAFSSTVFAIKVFEQKGETASLHARIAVGVLVVQDVAAVLFLAFSTGKVPSPWALGLLALLPLRPVLTGALERAGRGELLILYGLLLAFGGALLFDALGLKGDLGALVFGVLVAEHPRAEKLAKTLLGFKDLFLVGFFLTIGLRGLPTLGAVGAASLAVLAIPLKAALFFLLFTRFRLRARTAALASLALSSYSEFGLIVGAVAVSAGWLPGEWLLIVAIALSLSFVAASVANRSSHELFWRHRDRLSRYEAEERLPYDRPIDPGDAEILVFGLGGVGSAAYRTLRDRYGPAVLGLDCDAQVVRRHRERGWAAVADDATDPDFWERLRPGRVRLVLLALPSAAEVATAVRLLRAAGFPGAVAAAARDADDAAALRLAGVDDVLDLYEGLGAAFAELLRPRLAAS